MDEKKINIIYRFCKKIEELGIENIILTDINRDGTMEGQVCS